MILLPRSWSLERARSVVAGFAWILILLGVFGSYREACGSDGWGAFVLVVFGIALHGLLALSAPGSALAARVLRGFAVLALMLPGSVMLVAMFKELVRGAC